MQLLLAESSLVDQLSSCPTFQSWSPVSANLVAAIIHVALVGAFFGLPAGLFIWLERKVSGRIQDRLGPTRTGGRFGWLQSLADGIKLVQKEDLAPKQADQLLFRIAPYIVVGASFCAYLSLPFSDGWDAVGIDNGLFLLMALLALEVIGVILAGYSSASKWALFGAMRESAQMISYEIPMAICALVPVILAGTLNLNDIVRLQVGTIAEFKEYGFPPFINWFIFHPVGLPAFACYFTCATASCKRAPFDLAEAESELVAGFLTEYSGMRWSVFFLAEYASMFLVSSVAVALFLGGWDDGFGLLAMMKAEGYVFSANLIGMAIFMLKASKLVFIQIWIRWTLPRIRIDQVMTTCLKYLIPISCALFLTATIYPLVVSQYATPQKANTKAEPESSAEKTRKSDVAQIPTVGRPHIVPSAPIGNRLVRPQSATLNTPAAISKTTGVEK